jgi:hypothetical protein
MDAWTTTTAADGTAFTDVTASDFAIRRPADVLELVGAGVARVILEERQLADDFFDLSTGFAGELLQKCANYGLRVAVVVREERDRSSYFREFVRETNRGDRFVFVASVEEALARLAT